MTEKEIKEIVEKEISKTKELIEEYKEQTKPVAPDVAIGRISRMDAINNKSVVEAALRQSKNKLNQLEIVLSKIGTEDFGICARCNKQIPIGRIMVMPSSVHCVNCAI